MTYYIAEIRFNRKNRKLKRDGRMRKRLIVYLTTLLLIFLVFSTSIIILSVSACRRKRPSKNRERNGLIIKSLRELYSNISDLPNEAFVNPCRARCQRKVLLTKVCVVIWQVKVGAYWGALNKLENDIKEKIERWIVDPWKSSLIEKVEHIIGLLEKLFYRRDRTPPTVRIDEPADESYLSGVVSIRGYAYDVNFDRAELRINDILESQWTTTGTYTFDWNTNTSDYPDGIYTIKLTAYDKAENMNEKAITVTVDNTLPSAIINAPEDKSFLKGSVLINVTGNDDNFDRMELYIDDTPIKTWTISGNKLYTWNTMVYSDGFHMITLTVHDKAGNEIEAVNTVTVDNILPTALIMAPLNGSFLKGTVSINVFGDDDSFDEMKLYIGGTLVATFDTSGAQTYTWDTTVYSDGAYKITLMVYDKTHNFVTAEITVTVDNTPPSLGIPTWDPKEPFAYEEVNASVTVTELISGLKSVTLWYRTDGEWHSIEMTMEGKWTAPIPEQSAGVNVKFYVEAYDNMENSDKTLTYDYTVKAKVLPNSPPEAKFTESAESVSTGEAINFDASESNDTDGYIVSYLWNFGDGVTEIYVKDVNLTVFATHVYADDGNYIVTLTVTDNDGASSSKNATKTVLNRLPVANFTWSPDVAVINQIVTFDASASNDPDGYIVSYLWNFGDGNITTVASPIIDHTYTEDGNYTVTLTVTDDDGGESSPVSTTITVETKAELPLALLAAIGLGIAALTATLLYALYRRRKKGKSAANPGNKVQPKPVVTLYVPAKILSLFEIRSLNLRKN